MSTVLNLLTYNIHKGMNTGNRRFVLHTMREALRETGCDVLLLQEIHGEYSGAGKDIHGWPDNNQLEYIADDIWPYHAYGKNAVYQRGHHGNAILSRYPLTVVDNIDISLMRRASRSLLHVNIELPGRQHRLHMICVHLGLLGFERDRQFMRMVQHVTSAVDEGDALVIAGDFNDWRGKAARHFGGLAGMREVFEFSSGRYARTFPSMLPMMRMDRIYVRGCEVQGCKRLIGHPWGGLSDHIPLLVELQI